MILLRKTTLGQNIVHQFFFQINLADPLNNAHKLPH